MAINKLIFAFVTLILGVALLGSVAVLTTDATSKAVATNEAHTIIKNGTDINETYIYTVTNAPTGWKAEESDCVLNGVILRNTSDSTWASTTDYVFDTDAGTFTLVNSSDVVLTSDDLTNVNYNYCPDDYINSSWGRTVINMIGGFFALALLFVSLAMFYSIAKESGIV